MWATLALEQCVEGFQSAGETSRICCEFFRIHSWLAKKRQHDLRAAVILDDAQWDMDVLSIANVDKMVHDSKIIVAREPNADGTFRAIREPVVAILPRIGTAPCRESVCQYVWVKVVGENITK